MNIFFYWPIFVFLVQIITCGEVPSLPRMKTNMKVAYFGDNWNGREDDAREVLRLVNSELERGDMIVHTGDLGCGNEPWTWCDLMEEEIHSDIAYFATVGEGRKEAENWDEYTSCLRRHNEIATGHDDVDDYCFCKHDNCYDEDGGYYEDGIIQACVYGGVLTVYAAYETHGHGYPYDYTNDEYLEFIEEVFEEYESQYDAKWKVCVFHFLKGKFTITGPGETSTRNNALLDLCRSHGAMIVGGNAHSYARTHSMMSFEDDTWQTSYGDSGERPVMLNIGQSISIVSGLGGARKHSHNTNIYEMHWAAAGTKDLCLDKNSHELVKKEIGYGALICTYNFNGNPTLGRCEFLEVGRSDPFDQFYISVQDMMSEIDYSSFDSTFSRAQTPNDYDDDSYSSTSSESTDTRDESSGSSGSTNYFANDYYRSSEAGSSSYIDDGVVEICHRPDNPDSRRTKTISWSAWEQHEEHGDTLGPCTDTKNDLKLLSERASVDDVYFKHNRKTDYSLKKNLMAHRFIILIGLLFSITIIILLAQIIRSFIRRKSNDISNDRRICTHNLLNNVFCCCNRRRRRNSPCVVNICTNDNFKNNDESLFGMRIDSVVLEEVSVQSS